MNTGKFKRWIQIDWDAIAGIIAALIAIVMHYLHALEVDVLLMITLVLLALLFIRDLRSESRVGKAGWRKPAKLCNASKIVPAKSRGLSILRMPY